MGLLSFVKSAGAKIFGGDDEKEIEKQAKAQAPDDKQMAAMREKLRRAKMEGRLKQQIEQHGLKIEGLHIQVDGETVRISGKVADQATREKILLAVGNTAGISAVDDAIEVETPEPESQFHTVERGDTLSAIAKKYYGKASKYPVIFEANKPMLDNPDRIYPGQVLRIPAIDG